MNKQEADTAQGALIKVQKMIQDDELTVFTKEEAAALQEMAKVWGQLKAVITLGGAIGSGLKWVVVIIAAWAAFKAGLVDWMKTALAGVK